jgi:hypothetical protein
VLELQGTKSNPVSVREGPIVLCCIVLYFKHNQVVSHDAVHPDTGTNSAKNGSL